MTKTAYQEPNCEMDNELCVSIKGLREVSPGMFVIDGVTRSRIDIAALAAALNRDYVPDVLADRIGDLVMRYDIAEMLAERIEL